MKIGLAALTSFIVTALMIVILSLRIGRLPDEIPFPCIGKVKPRQATEITSSNWSVGAETMDREYTIYKNWRQYLGLLGVKKARVQSGWARTEVEKGVYDWAWLDEIVFDMVAQGVEPWLSLSYGNPYYTTSTGDSRGDIPKTEEAWKAWAKYVRNVVLRYDDVIDEWEIWNEPRMGKDITPREYADLVIRTAEVIRDIQPHAQILILALDHRHFEGAANADCPATPSKGHTTTHCTYAREVMDLLKAEKMLHLVNEVTYHPYAYNPDDVYEDVEAFRAFVHSYDPNIGIRQGENGVPSELNQMRALADYPWTERSQAKWALRRLLGDLGHDIPSSYFSIIDMAYQDEINRKGLIKARPDKTIDHPKEAYFAVQHLTSIFDDRLERIPNYGYEADSDSTLSVYAYRHRYSDQQVVTIWMNGSIPGDNEKKIKVNFTFHSGKFADPVYVDLRDGKVYQIPEANWSKDNDSYRFTGIPVYDAPVLIADKSIVEISQIRRN